MIEIEGAISLRTPDYPVPLHINPELEIVHVRRGVLHATYDGIPMELLPGNLLLVLPYRLHSYTSSADIDATVYMFSDEIYGEWMKFGVLDIHSPVRDDPALNAYVRSLVLRLQEKYDTLCIRSLFYALVNACQQEVSAESSHAIDLPDGKVISYVLEHLNEKLTVERIAKHVGISPRELSTGFKKQYGIKLVELIGNIRTEQAATMLRLTNFDVSQIASACGFGSLRNFNRCFLQRFQVPPREFRSQWAEKQSLMKAWNEKN